MASAAEAAGVHDSAATGAPASIREGIIPRKKPHPLYKKVIGRSVKFMAHDELGSAEGDTVRIIESRPMSARKRWQVIEIIAKAEKL